MAINKNFVVKNGIEVNTSLIVADTTLNKVGVGTTVPGYTLHVGGSRGGIGATDITITGIATVGTSGSTSSALSVVGVSSFQGDVNFLGSAGVSTITFDASLDKLNFADNARATFGASDDLQIFHDGSNSIIRETGTGNIVLEGSGETLAVFADDGAVSLYYDNANVFQTTPQGVNVSGVTTSNRLNISGVSTFTSIGSNLIPDGDGSRNIGAAGSEWQDLHIDGTANIDTLVADTAAIGDLTENRVVIAGSSGELEDDSNFTFDGAMLKVGTAATVAVNGNAAFAGIVTVGGDLKVTGDIEISEDLVLDTNLNLLGIASISNLDNTGAGIGSLSVSGVSTFSGDLIVGVSTFFVDVSTGRIGIGTNVPSAALQVGATAGTGIGVSIHENGNAGFTGIVTVGGVIDANGGINASSAKVEDLTNNRVVIAGTGGELEDSGNLTFDGSTLAVTGDETVSGKVSVGSGVTAFANGNLAVAGISTFNGNVLVGTGITIQPHGGVSIAGITTIGGDLNVTGNSYFVGMVTFAGGTNGNITLGDSSGDNVVFNADVNSNVIPNTNNAYDLGSSSQQWKDIYVDGVGYIDTVSADGVGIATATIRDSAKLDVDGDARFSGKVAVKDGGNAGAGVTIFDNGNIAASGIITASTFVGSFSGTVTTATNITVADESSDTTCFPLFATDATGDVAPKSGSNLTFNSNTGALTATSFAGNLTGGTVSGTTGTFSGDVDIADKIVHTGNVNTAIRFPASNTFTVDTNGSERLRVTANGGVGVNTTSVAFGLFQVTQATNTDEGGIGILDSTKARSMRLYCTDTLGVINSGNGGASNLILNEGSGSIGVGTVTVRDSAKFDVDGGGRFNGDVSFSGSTGAGSTVLFDQSDNSLKFVDSAKAKFGSGNDLEIYHDGSHSRIVDSGTGHLIIQTSELDLMNAAGSEDMIKATQNGSVELYHNNVKKLETTADGVDLSGTGSIKVPVGTTAQRPTGQAGDFRYNSTTGSFEGYTDEWGAIAGSGGGASESDTSVSSTSATSIYTTAHATNRSVSAIIQITQGSSYQVGRYLVIHDGTTATIIEESAVATGDMLGTFTADINGSNLRILVNMSSASSATVTILPTVVTV